MPLIFLDSNIVIYYIEGSSEMQEVLRERLEESGDADLLEDAESGGQFRHAGTMQPPTIKEY